MSKEAKEKSHIEWVNYFRSKQSDHMNFIMGIVISMLFGIVSLTSNMNTSTILGLFTFLILIAFLLLYFFQRYQTYYLMETIAKYQSGI